MSIIKLLKCYLANIFVFWYYLDMEVMYVNEISSRIKELRKYHLKISQQEFADRLLLKRNSIAHFETGVRNPSDRTIITICETFNVNEQWLRTGEGEMFREQTEEEEIAAYMGKLMNGANTQATTDFQKRFIKALAKLDIDDWKIIEKFCDKLMEENEKGE